MTRAKKPGVKKKRPAAKKAAARKAPKKAATPRKYSGPERRRPVLIIQHAQYEHPAALRRALESQGIETHWIHPYRGESYPELSSIRGVISLGGPMGANDEHEHAWITPELKLLREAVEKELPIAGICLGGQLMARALGGKVEKNATPEIGWFRIEVNTEGTSDRILRAAGPEPVVYHWHNDTFHLPAGATLLAHSASCPRQAYRIGETAYGFQFHPEADHQLLEEWLSTHGIDDELDDARATHGPETVQDSAAQRAHASLGEKSSLKITAAIGQLFQTRPYEPASRASHDQLEQWALHQRSLIVEFEGSDRKLTRLRGRIVTLLAIPDGEFLIFKDDSTVLWPIRLDHIRKIRPA